MAAVKDKEPNHGATCFGGLACTSAHILCSFKPELILFQLEIFPVFTCAHLVAYPDVTHTSFSFIDRARERHQISWVIRATVLKLRIDPDFNRDLGARYVVDTLLTFRLRWGYGFRFRRSDALRDTSA